MGLEHVPSPIGLPACKCLEGYISLSTSPLRAPRSQRDGGKVAQKVVRGKFWVGEIVETTVYPSVNFFTCYLRGRGVSAPAHALGLLAILGSQPALPPTAPPISEPRESSLPLQQFVSRTCKRSFPMIIVWKVFSTRPAATYLPPGLHPHPGPPHHQAGAAMESQRLSEMIACFSQLFLDAGSHSRGF